MASSPSPPSAAYSPSGKTRVAPGLSSVDLLQLATSSLAAAVAASQPIRRLAEPEPEPEPERDQQDQQDQQQEHEHHQQQQLLQQTQQNGGGSQKNVRTKLDGTVVTDADGAAQRIIVAAIRHVSSDVRIVGEESRKEMESNQSREFEEATRRFLEMDVGGGGGNVNTHVNGSGDGDSTGRSNTKTNGDGGSDEVQHEIAGIFEMVREEITKRYNEAVARDISLPIVDDDDDNDDRSNTNTHAKPPSGTGRKAATCSKCAKRSSHHRAKMLSPRDRTVDSSRVSVLIDPLDGTSCYASGKHEYVTTLVAIVLDNTPIFGVICKPFGHAGEPCILNSGCFAVYGGALLGGIYVAGGDEIERSRSCRHESQQANDALPSGDDCRRCVDAANRKAVISKSRAGGVVGKCIAALADEGLLHREPVLISGAGVKALQLLVGTQDESLWFFPKAGTSLWDVAAADALLRVIGGRLSDKNGNDIDYSKSRYDAENNDGIIVCNDAVLHSECVQIFQEADWRDDD